MKSQLCNSKSYHLLCHFLYYFLCHFLWTFSCIKEGFLIGIKQFTKKLKPIRNTSKVILSNNIISSVAIPVQSVALSIRSLLS